MTKFYYQTYDNYKYPTVNSQQLWRQYPPTYNEVQDKWKLSLLEKCETSGQIWDVINSKLWVKSFTALLHKAKTYPVVYDKWGILRKNFLNNLIEKDD